MGIRARVRRWTSVAMAGAGLAAIVLAASLPPRGPILIEVLSPVLGATIDLRGAELLVRALEHAIAGTPAS